MRFCLLLLVVCSSLLYGQDSELYYEMKDRLGSIEMDLRTGSSDIEIAELLIDFQLTLREYLVRADSRYFIEELGELDPMIERIGDRSNMFYYRFRPYRFSQSYTVTDKDGQIVCFTNTYRSNEPLTEKEKSELFFLEMNSYEEFGIHPRYTLTKETIGDLEPDQTYNFVVTSDKIIHYAPDYEDPTIYHTTDSGISVKRIISPNHTILAGNQPVLAAGTFVVWEHEDRRLIFLSNDSGHFRTDYESLQVFKKHLKKMGIEAERVICVAIQVDYQALLARLERRNGFQDLH